LPTSPKIVVNKQKKSLPEVVPVDMEHLADQVQHHNRPGILVVAGPKAGQEAVEPCP
jgi:uncharacterized protein YciI